MRVRLPLAFGACLISVISGFRYGRLNTFTVKEMAPSQQCKLNPMRIALKPQRGSARLAVQASLRDERSKNQSTASVTVSQDILSGLLARTKTGVPLDLATDFFDPSTGLHNEGVWHNSLIAIACLHASNERKQFQGCARRVADSLFEHSWDGVSFRRRVHSGLWDHSPLDGTSTKKIEQMEYYRSSSEHRCVQHGMALVFWTFLREAYPKDALVAEQFLLISAAFVEQFWDENASRWRTLSKTQGGGSLSRKSSSTGRPGPASDAVYYRAVDHAVGLLATVRMLKTHREGDAVSKSKLMEMATITCRELLSSSGFGYRPGMQARSYIGVERGRNLWHDGWVVLALLCARRYAWPKDEERGEGELRGMLAVLVDEYGRCDASSKWDGTLRHWAKAKKDDRDNVRYCGDNALFFAVVTGLGWAPPPGEGRFQRAFAAFVSELLDNAEGGGELVSVGDVYRQVRLHPNSELAALLLWPIMSW